MDWHFTLFNFFNFLPHISECKTNWYANQEYRRPTAAYSFYYHECVGKQNLRRIILTREPLNIDEILSRTYACQLPWRLNKVNRISISSTFCRHRNADQIWVPIWTVVHSFTCDMKNSKDLPTRIIFIRYVVEESSTTTYLFSGGDYRFALRVGMWFSHSIMV